MKIAVFIINLLIQLAFAVFGLFILLLSLNGYSERQSNPGIFFYVVISIVSAFGAATLSSYTAGRLAAAKSAFGKFWSAVIAIISFTVVGGTILIVGFFAAVILTEALR